MNFLDELITMNTYPPRPEGSFTIRDFMSRAEALGLPEMGYSAARTKLEQLVKTGTLCRVQCIVEDRVTNVYWEGETPIADKDLRNRFLDISFTLPDGTIRTIEGK